MPQPIQGPTLADVGANLKRREREIKGRGKISARGQKELAKIAELGRTMVGSTGKERARQRAISKEMKRLQKDLNSRGNMRDPRRYNSLFKESDRIARRARDRADATKAAATKKAAKAKAAKKAAKKRASTIKKAGKKAAKKTARPAKKAAKKVAKKAAPVKKAAKKSR